MPRVPNPHALLLTPDFPPGTGGGIELVMQRLAAGLAAIDVQVVTLGRADAASFDARQPFPIIRVGTQRDRNKAAVALLNARGLLAGARARPDVLICGHAVAAPAAAALRSWLKRPSLQYVHAEEFRDRPRVAAFAVRSADRVVAVSRYSESLALGAGVQRERVHRVHPGVELARPGNAPKCRRPTIVTVARLRDREKGHDILMRALPLIRRNVPEVQWIVIGEGPLRSELEATARRQGLESAVRFLGAVSDAERNAWLARSHVFALPNHAGEGFGIVFLEAAVSGLPVVAGAVGGALDAVADGETGLLVDARDHRAVAEAVQGLLLDPARAARLGRAGATRARRFTWEAHVAEVERLLLELHATSARNGFRRGAKHRPVPRARN